MHLFSLTLINVRQFRHRTFNFQPGFNLLVGENGAGKTTILRSLLASLGGTRQIGQRLKLEDDDIRLREEFAEIKSEIQNSTNHIDKFTFRKSLWKHERPPRRKNLPLVLFYSSNEAACAAMKGRRPRKTTDLEDEKLRRNEEFLYEAEMEFSRKPSDPNERSFGDSYSIRRFVGRILSDFSSDFRDFFWHFEPFDCAIIPGEKAKNSQFSELFKNARNHAMRYFQERKKWRRSWHFQWPDKSKLLLTPEPSDRDSKEWRLPRLREIWEEMKITQEERNALRFCSLEVRLAPRIVIRRKIGHVNLNQLSDGEQRIFSLFVDIARQLSLHDPRYEIGKGEAIILIDEIDVHLHPKWQRKIVSALEDLFSECQFIATTHSPFVIQATNREKITAIDAESLNAQFKSGNSIEDIVENIQGIKLPQRGARAEILSKASRHYFQLLKKKAQDATAVTRGELENAERAYREASEPFASDPAVHALLMVQTIRGGLS